MIGVDWGTSSLRAFRLSSTGDVLDRVEAPQGILHVEAGGFPLALREHIGGWLTDGETRVLLSGMVGSRQGWAEAAYLPCPASLDDLAGSLTDLPFEGAHVKLVPGLSAADPSGIPEVMRGEETQIFGAAAEIGGDALVCLPGSHSKWVTMRAGRIEGFSTYLSGECFAAIRAGTILGRMMPAGAPHSPDGFTRGLERAREPGHLLHHLFGVRTQGLFGTLADTDSASYLSGLLIGHEIAAALGEARRVHLIGNRRLSGLYAEAIGRFGTEAVILTEDAAASGLFRIAERTRWSCDTG